MPKRSFGMMTGGAAPGPSRVGSGIRQGAKRAKMGGRGAYPGQLRSIKPEVKTVDLFQFATNFDTIGTFTCVNLPLEGASFYNRIGRKIMAKSLHVFGHIECTDGNAGATGEDYGRLMVIYDRQPNGALPAVADVLTSYNNAGATSSTASDSLNMNNRDRFVVLRDERIVLPAVGALGVTPINSSLGTDPTLSTSKREINFFIKCKDLETHFKASAGTIGDIATGSIFVFSISGQSHGNLAYIAAVSTRLRYHDV